MAGVWEWASWCSRCHMIPLRGESLRAEWECESVGSLLAASLLARLPAASPYSSPQAQVVAWAQAQTEAAEAARRTACVLASR